MCFVSCQCQLGGLGLENMHKSIFGIFRRSRCQQICWVNTNMTQHIVRPPPFVHLEYLCQFLCGHSVITYMHSAPSYKHILGVFFFS